MKLWSCLLGAAVTLLATHAIEAASVTATYEGDSPTQTVNITSSYLPSAYNGGGFYTGLSHFDNVVVTPNDATTAGIQSTLGSGFTGFCIDLTHLIWGGQRVTWDVASLDTVTSLNNGIGITSDKAHAIKSLWTNHLTGASDPTGATSATFQMALWKIIYGNAVTFTNNGNIADAGAWATAALADTNTLATPIYALVNGRLDPNATTFDVQNFSVAIFGPTGQPPAVPLPPAALMGLSMLGGLGSFKWLRNKKTKAS